MTVDPSREELTRSERVSWALQACIRNFWFIGTITLIAIFFAIRGHIWTLDVADAWNYCMSWLALWIESIVGIAMFGQVQKDARVLREVREMDVKITAILTHIEGMIEDDFTIQRRLGDERIPPAGG